MKGKLIFVTGYFGSGKSTLVRVALESIDNLRYLRTITTRPRRKDEDNSFEYIFVTKEEYKNLRDRSKVWDHTIAGEYSYGADVDTCKNLLAEGKDIICCVVPDSKVIEEMSSIYGVKPLLIWIDTSLEVANNRLKNSGDELRWKTRMQISGWLQSEENGMKIQNISTYVFKPINDINEDKKKFVAFIKKITST